MEIIKRKILFEDGISRNYDTTYGNMTATTFNFMLHITQTVDDMGLFTDYPYVNEAVDYGVLLQKLNLNGLTFPFMSGQAPPSVILSGFTACTRWDGANVSEWYAYGGPITAITDSRLAKLKSYDKNNPYIPGFDIETKVYTNYDNQTVNGVSRVTSYVGGFSGTTEYVFDAENDANIGTSNQTTGLRLIDSKIAPPLQTYGLNYKNLTVKRIKPPLTKLYYNGEGWNNTNISLSALTKEEYLLGITRPPEVFSDVFIDRGATTVMEMHLKLSEVESLDHLQWFGNGFYKINKQ